MLNIPPNTTIYWHTEPTDMRKGIDGLSGIVRGEFDGDPLDGSLYLFGSSGLFLGRFIGSAADNTGSSSRAP